MSLYVISFMVVCRYNIVAKWWNDGATFIYRLVFDAPDGVLNKTV